MSVPTVRLFNIDFAINGQIMLNKAHRNRMYITHATVIRWENKNEPEIYNRF